MTKKQPTLTTKKFNDAVFAHGAAKLQNYQKWKRKYGATHSL